MDVRCLQKPKQAIGSFLRKGIPSSSASHKVALWGIGFFIALSVMAVGMSCFSFTPLSLKWPLRIGGGLGMGIGLVGCMGLLALSRRKVEENEESVLLCIRKTFRFPKEDVSLIECLKNNPNRAWKGWIEFALVSDGHQCDMPQGLRFFNSQQTRKETYHCPVTLAYSNDRFKITLPSSKEIILSDTNIYSRAAVHKKLQYHFL